MSVEEIKAGSKVWDDQCPQFGEGQVLNIEDDIIEVHYQSLEEVVSYSYKEGLKYLNLIL